MGGCQNYGPFLLPYILGARITIWIQKVPISSQPPICTLTPLVNMFPLIMAPHVGAGVMVRLNGSE